MPSAAAVLRGGEAGAATDRLWAKAAELERDFAGYKRRLAERRAQAVAFVAGGGRADGEHGGEEERGDDGEAAAAGRGRRYEEYVRRRDERLRHEWRARMERKEAEVKALWARLDRAAPRGRAGADGGELVAIPPAGHAREDHVKLQQKPGTLEVRVKPAAAPVTPRCSPAAATKLARPRTSMAPSPAAASPRLSTPDTRRRVSHREQSHVEPPATPRRDSRLAPPPTAAAPVTPRPRTAMLSRSRTMLKDRGGGRGSVGDSPRPPRLQPPRSSCDSVIKEPPAAAADAVDALAMVRSSPCFSGKRVRSEVKKASAVAPGTPNPRRSSNGVDHEHATAPLVTPKAQELDGKNMARAGGKPDSKCKDEGRIDQSSEKLGGVEITGDSDTEPSFVYIKKDSDEQAPRPCPGTDPLSDNDTNKDGDNGEGTTESTGSNDVAGETPVTDAEEPSRRESSESLYSNVQSSFSPRSELDASATGSPLPGPPCSAGSPAATERPPEPDAPPRPRKNTEVEENAGKSLPIATTPRSRSSTSVSTTVQSPMDAMAGLKRLLTFGKRNGKGGEAAAVQRLPRPLAYAAPASEYSVSGEWPAAAGDPAEPKLGSSDIEASDDLDNGYVISPHVRSVQSFAPSYPGNPELKEPVAYSKSPRVPRSFFSFSSFKARPN